MKWRRRILLIVVACAVAGGVVVAVWPREREPEYNGMKLSEWLARADCAGSPDRGTIEAEGAVRSIGRDAVPLFLRWIRYEPSDARAGTYRLVSRCGRKIGVPRSCLNCALALLRNEKAEERARRATLGFVVLGREAEAAVPVLGELAVATNSPESSRRAIIALGWTGPSGAAVLEKVSRDAKHPWCGVAAVSLQGIPYSSRGEKTIRDARRDVAF